MNVEFYYRARFQVIAHVNNSTLSDLLIVIPLLFKMDDLWNDAIIETVPDGYELTIIFKDSDKAEKFANRRREMGVFELPEMNKLFNELYENRANIQSDSAL